jgi:3-keto-5-aminohexanoate cleavage enzyme
LKKKFILEARVNEYAMRDGNTHVPWTADEIAETSARVRAEGAAILHFHARNAEGAPLNTVEAYEEIIRKVRAKSDILILPTLGFISNDTDAKRRIDCVAHLAKDPATKPDIAPIDTGTANLETYDPTSRRFGFADRVYENRTDTLIHYCETLRASKVKPKLVSWSVGFTRRAMALLDAGFVSQPAYLLFHLTDGPYITGHPATEEGLRSHLAFLPRDRNVEWTVNALGGNLLRLAPMIAQEGGHMALGIGDYPYKELNSPPNEVLVQEAVGIIRSSGRDMATPNDVREMLAL